MGLLHKIMLCMTQHEWPLTNYLKSNETNSLTGASGTEVKLLHSSGFSKQYTYGA
jgi:hypothetical protein